MKISVAILISGEGSNMVELVKSMDNEHPAFPSVVISNRPDAKGLLKAQDLGVPTKILETKSLKNFGLDASNLVFTIGLMAPIGYLIYNGLPLDCLDYKSAIKRELSSIN